MRAMVYGLLCAAFAICGQGLSSTAKPDPASQLKWAKGIADDFWRAVFAFQAEQAAGLLSPELSKSLVTQEWSGAGEGHRLLDLPAGEWLGKRLPRGPDVIVAFDSQELSPEGSEVVFRGHLMGKAGDEEVNANFTMRLVRESAGGKWCIRFLLVTDGKKADGKGP
jgi:hypothetical protein